VVRQRFATAESHDGFFDRSQFHRYGTHIDSCDFIGFVGRRHGIGAGGASPAASATDNEN
jgi:hypothetical protein